MIFLKEFLISKNYYWVQYDKRSMTTQIPKTTIVLKVRVFAERLSYSSLP